MTASGAKTAERAPTTTVASPATIRSRSSRRSASERPEWSSATRSPKRARKRPTRLRRQRDLGHEDDRAAARGERGLARADVDLGLAAAGRAGEEDVAAAAREQSSRSARARASCVSESWAGVGSAARAGRRRHGSRRSPRRVGCCGAIERERAGRRRAVVVREPEREIDERRRERLEHALGRDRLDVGRRLDVDVDDDAAPTRVAEADRDERRPSPPRPRSRT